MWWLAFGQNPFCPLVVQFWDNIRDNKKRHSILLLWDKDSCIESPSIASMHMCMEPIFVHLYKTSSLLPGPLPIVALANLKLLYSLLYSEHINHIQVLGFLPFPCFSCVHFPISVWPMSYNITALVLGL
jgi:hypothetical protein